MQIGGVSANENKVYDCQWIFKVISNSFFFAPSLKQSGWEPFCLICQLEIRTAPHVKRLFKVLHAEMGNL